MSLLLNMLSRLVLCIRICKAGEVQLASSHLTVTIIHWTWQKSVIWVIFCLIVGKLETVVSVRRKMGDGRGNNRVVGRGCHVGLKCPTRIQWWSLLWEGGRGGGGCTPVSQGLSPLPAASRFVHYYHFSLQQQDREVWVDQDCFADFL